jgi:toxin ParE1/3/4
MMRLRFLRNAENELTSSAKWYDRQQSGLGSRFVDAVSSSRHRIVADPLTLPRSEHYRGPRDIRRCPVDDFPYQLIFEIRPDELVVLAVAHGSRRPGYWARRR